MAVSELRRMLRSMRRAMALVAVILVSCTGRAAPSPTPATTGFAVPSLAPSPTPSATIAADSGDRDLAQTPAQNRDELRPQSLRREPRYLGGVKLKNAP